MKTWEQLTAAQKEHCVKLANEAGIPMANVTTGVYHTRGDFISGAAWQFLKAWGIWAGEQSHIYEIVAARDEMTALELVIKKHGVGNVCLTPPDELFVVAGEAEPRILKTIDRGN